MNEQQRSAYLISQSACAAITAMGMQAENKQREYLGQPMAYQEDAFQKVISDLGIGTNAAIEWLLRD